MFKCVSPFEATLQKEKKKKGEALRAQGKQLEDI